jgi:hypothetical protein
MVIYKEHVASDYACEDFRVIMLTPIQVMSCQLECLNP